MAWNKKRVLLGQGRQRDVRRAENTEMCTLKKCMNLKKHQNPVFTALLDSVCNRFYLPWNRDQFSPLCFICPLDRQICPLDGFCWSEQRITNKPPRFLSFSVLGRFGACFMCRNRGFKLNYAFTFGPGEAFISFSAWDSEQTSESEIHWTAPIFKQPRSGLENLGSGIETLEMAQPGIHGKWEGISSEQIVLRLPKKTQLWAGLKTIEKK